MNQLFEIPESLTQLIHRRLSDLSLDPEDLPFMANQIKKLSDFYIENPKARTPYQSESELKNFPWVEVASLVYFFPLNFLRNLKVAEEAQRLGFLQGLENIIEFGAGFGPSSWALQLNEKQNSLMRFKKFYWIESSPLAHTYSLFFKDEFKLEAHVETKVSDHLISSLDLQKTLAVFSYSLTELTDIPTWAERCEALLIVEPSTQEDGRRLQALRPRLLEKGFSLWGPCLHDLECPLLKHSKKDWCHDRLLFQRPQWLKKVEDHLAWENKSLTFSYLLARKMAPSWKGKTFSHKARVIGDTLFEKGKTRQLLCKDDQRLFFSWLTKEGPAPHIPRGSLVEWKTDEVKSNEVRPGGAMELITSPLPDAEYKTPLKVT